MITTLTLGDPLDPLFLEVVEEIAPLKRHAGFTGGDLFNMYQEVLDHISHLALRHGAFWTKFTPDEEISATLFYDMVLSRVGVSLDGISPETADKRVYLLIVAINDRVAEMMSHFFNYLIRKLQADPWLAIRI